MKRNRVAVIDEERCIGCTLCIEACPVDAIVGARGLMHTVVERYCIGCDLCVPPCPVDCIEMAGAADAWTVSDATAARARAHQRKTRLAREAAQPLGPKSERRATVQAAIARVRAKRTPKADRAA